MKNLQSLSTREITVIYDPKVSYVIQPWVVCGEAGKKAIIQGVVAQYDNLVEIR